VLVLDGVLLLAPSTLGALKSNLRSALHLEAGPIPLQANCIKFQPLLGWRLASTIHYEKIITWANF
jgi:hypothetical protein